MGKTVRVMVLLLNHENNAKIQQEWAIDISRVSAVSVTDNDKGNCLVDGASVIVVKGHDKLRRAFNEQQKPE